MLFKTEPTVATIIPATFYKASVLASRILRSDFHKTLLCTMHFDPITLKPHIDEQVLSTFLTKNEIFMVDKIRHMNMLNARACTIREYDAFKIYLNPLLLLEMIDKEREAAELQTTGIDQWEDLMSPMVEKFDAITGDPVRRKHNSLVYSHQYNKLFPATTHAASSKKASKATSLATPGSTDPVVPSDLTVEEKHIWMLTILMVHEGDHLLNGMFSTYLINRRTPEKLMRDTDQLNFQDIGHMMELKLYGWVIQHGFDDTLPSPFAIQEILGATHTASNMPKRVITPSAQMRALLADPDDLTIPITADVLAATVTGNGYYQQASKPVELGTRNSASAVDDFVLELSPTALQGESLGSEYKNLFDSWKA